MAYQLKEVSIRTNNTAGGMQIISELWGDIMSGKLPILFDSTHTLQRGTVLVSKYSNYESDERGDYDLSIKKVTDVFFEELEAAVGEGRYKKYETSDANGDLDACTKEAWKTVWNEQSIGTIRRAYSTDYESTVPAMYAEDKMARCCLYIALK